MIFITGFHHSGTSILAKTIARMGFEFGGPLDRHHEHEELKRQDEAIIGSWMNPVETRAEIKLELPADVEACKDPRLMMTANEWHKVYPDAQWIFIERDPYDVAIDLMDDKSRPQDPRFWLELQEIYAGKFKKFLLDNPKVLRGKFLQLSYDKLCGYPEFTIGLIGSFLGKDIAEVKGVSEWAKETYKFQTFKNFI